MKLIALFNAVVVVVVAVVAVASATADTTENERGRVLVSRGVNHEHPLGTHTPTPTHTPSPTPTVYVAPALLTPTPVQAHVARGALSRAQVVGLLRGAGFPEWTIPRAVRIAACESSWNTNATGLAGERGLFQIHPVHGWRSTYDPVGNVEAAYYLSKGGTNWSIWTCQ